MKIFRDFKTFNEYIGLPIPLDNDIDVGYYDPPNMLLKSDAITVEFYRISFKANFVDKMTPNAKPVNALFFISPGMSGGWDIEPTYKGMYVQLSKKIIEENRFLFRNHLDYGLHEPLFLTDSEIVEITTVFDLMIKYYNNERQNFSVLLSYVNVLVSLV